MRITGYFCLYLLNENRRLHGDLHWKHTTPTESIVNYFPRWTVALRTLKSELQTGLTEEQVESLKNVPGWLYTGKYGIIQCIKGFEVK
jgi:hypothetical protein